MVKKEDKETINKLVKAIKNNELTIDDLKNLFNTSQISFYVFAATINRLETENKT